MFFSLSLFSDLVCVSVLVPGYSSRVLGVISAMSRSYACLSLFLTYISSFCVIALLLPGSSVPLMMFLVMHHSVCLQVLPCFSITYFELCYKLTSHSFFKHFVCFGHTAVTRSSLCDFRWYSLVWIYQHGWAHHSRSTE